jgi:hypothetical protein
MGRDRNERDLALLGPATPEHSVGAGGAVLGVGLEHFSLRVQRIGQGGKGMGVEAWMAWALGAELCECNPPPGPPQRLAAAPETGMQLPVSDANEVGRSATSLLAGWVSAGDPGADAQGPGERTCFCSAPAVWVRPTWRAASPWISPAAFIPPRRCRRNCRRPAPITTCRRR